MQQDVAGAVARLAAGEIIILVDSQREMEADLAFSARHCSAAKVNFVLSHARGILCVALHERLANHLGIKRLQANGMDPFGTPFGMPVSLNDGTTSVSTAARARTICALAGGEVMADAFIKPGHVQTLLAHPGGMRSRQGHTEAVIALMEMAGEGDAGVLCEILNAEGEIASDADIRLLAQRFGLGILDLSLVHDHCLSIAAAP